MAESLHERRLPKLPYIPAKPEASCFSFFSHCFPFTPSFLTDGTNLPTPPSSTKLTTPPSSSGGHNLRPARLSNPASFECIFGWDFSHPKFYLSAEVTSAAQEIFRCRTPLSILHRRYTGRHLQAFKSPLVSVRFKAHGSFPLPSIARPEPLSSLPPMPRLLKPHRMCVCTMLRNQARFLREWILYHSRIGIERWFIYDNNSDDDIEHVVVSLSTKWNLLISLHEWPWVKTQEAGFAHCALRARPSCEWVGFLDVDEFLYFPSPEVKLHDVLRNYSKTPWVAEIRTACHSFGPSGRKKSPPEGVMIGYTCRIAPAERHKSIVRPEALNPSLINVVHHFHLKNGMKYVNMDLRIMVINHYKYQAWGRFSRRSSIAELQPTLRIGRLRRTWDRRTEHRVWERRRLSHQIG
ncbi:hypothetical protein HPP92_011383 [Vanilla planifolia]|uniref:Glycosyltransferase family 92 protein n=1 Tax=Vanilla planifolia TaxID=51239 RepID=A0A835R6X8_VANPL|nr:hypothetical protein HPP92_011383 [Vanilla planifolia]